MPQPVSFFDVAPLFEELERGQLVLTSNRRLASRIRNAYVLEAQRRGRDVVTTANVHSLSGWIEQLWQRLLLHAWPPALELRLLNSNQELLLWEQIVSGSSLGQALLRPSATAQQAAAAYRLLREWQLDLDDAELQSQVSASEDAGAWRHWALEFERRCRERQLLCGVNLPVLLIEALRQGALANLDSILLIGFQDIAPLHRALLENLGEPRHYQPPSIGAEVDLVQCESPAREIEAAAAWARQVLKHDSSARVAIVVADLNQQRSSVERKLLEVFDPGYNFMGKRGEDGESSGRGAPPFNVSAGYPLSQAPVISAALALLSLSQGTIALEVAESICLSPFGLNGDGDADRVAQLVSRCRSLNSFEIRVSRFRQLAADIAESHNRKGENSVRGSCGEDDDSENCSGDDIGWSFSEALQQAGSLCRNSALASPRSRDAWVEWFNRMLTLLGWPGARRLDSIEYQQVSQWQSALRQFAGLSLAEAQSPVSLGEALGELRSVLSRHTFQPQTADSPLQVLGLLEASGLQFSHLWLTGMSASQWPPAPTPNPLLPAALQRRLGMPHASAEREYRYAEKLTQQFLASAGRVVVSSPATIDDNAVAISALFSDYRQVELQQVLGRPLASLTPAVEIRRRYCESRDLETVAAGMAPALATGERVRGGVSIFSNQSACPFRAFARHRLYISESGQPELGLSAAERGNVLHRALELLWNKIHTQQALLEMDGETLRDQCRQASQYAVSQVVGRGDKTFGPRFQAIESERLEKLLLAWMEQEKRRENFVVVATEQRRSLRFSDLEFETRIDRIDRLDDGSLLFIDYKTGHCSPADWWGERPEQPQLPLYAVLSEEVEDHPGSTDTGIGAIAFAQVATGNCQLKGVGDENSPEPQLRWDSKSQSDSGQLNWQQQKRQWKKVLASLARDFVAGVAAVDPKHDPAQSPKTCQFCDLQALCRVSHEELEQ